MTKFGYWGGTEADENGKIWTNVSKNYNINDNTLIRNSSYNGPNIYSRYIYIFIDKNNDQIFDFKIEQLNEEGKKRMEEISDLNSRMNRLQTENDKNKKEIRDLKETNEILTEREKKNKKEKKLKKKIEKLLMNSSARIKMI